MAMSRALDETEAQAVVTSLVKQPAIESNSSDGQSTTI